jgi:integrase
MEILGHSTIATTADTYGHVMPELQRDATERTAAILFGT